MTGELRIAYGPDGISVSVPKEEAGGLTDMELLTKYHVDPMKAYPNKKSY